MPWTPDDEELASRIRPLLRGFAVTEKRMFGGVAWMIDGNMAVGIVKGALMVRCGPDAYDALAQKPGARPMDFAGKPMRGFLFVDPLGTESAAALAAWVAAGTAFAASLPAKAPGEKAPRKKRG